jgi:hypothetical protein
MLGVGNVDEHLCAVNIGRRVFEEFIKRLFVPRDIRGSEGRREVVAGYGSALAANDPGA